VVVVDNRELLTHLTPLIVFAFMFVDSTYNTSGLTFSLAAVTMS
jgi:hypothetical protein